MIDIKLDNCRYCGGEAIIEEWENTFDTDRIKIRCMRCGITLDHEQQWCLRNKYDKFGNVVGAERVYTPDMSAIEIWNGGMLNGKNS